MRTLYIPDTPLHLTYRLYGSIPNLPLQKLHSSHRLRKLRLAETFPADQRAANQETKELYREACLAAEVDHYLGYDELLDRPTTGPRYLRGAAAKRIVIDSWHHLAKQEGLKIYAVSVMDNHVHLLLQNCSENRLVSMVDTLENHKKWTATQLNRLHGMKGRRVWAEKEYSRTVRRGGFEHVLWYVLNNPVKAGLTEDPLSWEGNWWSPELYDSFIVARVA
ncbi:transposase [Lewinella sp. IMCC34183]|uniref:transposase n=1 Tax=Lewinella sp. IMCC34183 TaxID=2248762 RepID=UPI000E26F795|nr:transposase [Lewinella sp. IMCC34183]